MGLQLAACALYMQKIGVSTFTNYVCIVTGRLKVRFHVRLAKQTKVRKYLTFARRRTSKIVRRRVSDRLRAANNTKKPHRYLDAFSPFSCTVRARNASGVLRRDCASRAPGEGSVLRSCCSVVAGRTQPVGAFLLSARQKVWPRRTFSLSTAKTALQAASVANKGRRLGYQIPIHFWDRRYISELVSCSIRTKHGNIK